MSRYNHGHINWGKLLGLYCVNVLKSFYADISDRQDVLDWVSRNRKNPFTQALRDDPDKFIEAANFLNVFSAKRNQPNLLGLSEGAVITQMMLYDLQGGPEMDWKEKGQRRHWYAYFKQFAQLLANASGKTVTNSKTGLEEMKDVQWSGRMSQVYGSLVDSRAVTYRDLWIEDGSRMSEVFGLYQNLIPGLNLIIAVEKDSLFPDFVSASRAAGAIAIISGKGKNSKAATEILFRNLGYDDRNPSENLRLVRVATLSDYDYDGHGVIWPTFGEQMRRYADFVEEARIGIMPEQVQESGQDMWAASYQIKLSNTGYVEWAGKNAVWLASCTDCGQIVYCIGDPDQSNCEHCGGSLVLESEEAHGFETETLQSSDYYKAIVKAVLSFVPWEDILVELRNIATPNRDSVISNIADQQLDSLERVQKIDGAIRILQESRDTLRDQVMEHIAPVVDEVIESTADEWWALQDDPEVEDFEDHVVNAGRSGWGSTYRPFKVDIRNQFIQDKLAEDDEFISELKAIDFETEDFNDIVNDVIRTLE